MDLVIIVLIILKVQNHLRNEDKLTINKIVFSVNKIQEVKVPCKSNYYQSSNQAEVTQ